MAFPDNSTVLDNFNRANGDLGANWTTGVDGSANALTINTNAARATSTGTFCSGYWNAATFGADVSFYIVGNNNWGSGGSKGWVYGRLQSTGTSGVDGYAAEVTSLGTWEIRLYRIDNNVYTQLGSTGTGSGNFTSGDAVGLECLGSAIKAYSREGGTWTQEASATDSTYTAAGHTGLGLNVSGSTHAITDIVGGTVGGTITGTSAITLTAPTVSASGAETISGTAAITLTPSTVAASGVETMTGTAAVALPAVTVAATGDVVTVLGAGAITLPAVTSAASGAVTIAGSAAVTLAKVAADAGGTVLNPVTGEGAIGLSPVQMAASGSETILGTADVAVPAPSVSATGTEAITGTATAGLPLIATDAAGIVAEDVSGTAAVTLPVVIAAANGASFTPPPITVSLRTTETASVALRTSETASVALRWIDYDPDVPPTLYDEGLYDQGGYGGVSFYSVSVRRGDDAAVSLVRTNVATIALNPTNVASISVLAGE